MIIGSECDALRRLGFPQRLSADLAGALTESGEWAPALPDGMTSLNPTVRNLHATLRSAFAAASRQRATLLLWFIGHGLSVHGDYYFLARDSLDTDADGKPILDSQYAVHLAQMLKERIAGSPGLDGLVVGVDTCEAAAAAEGGAHKWPALVRQVSGRVDLLVASDDGDAYDGCFTETVLATFRSGIPTGGDNLLAADLIQPVARACPRQQPQHFSFAAGSPTSTADHGLWLVPNIARARDAVRGRPDAGTVDELTRGLQVTRALRSQVNTVAEHGHERLRAILGPSGSGKSTAVALLVRPDLLGVESATSAAHIGAAVFLTGTSTLASVTDELATQLDRRVAVLVSAGEIEPVAKRPQAGDEYHKVAPRLARPLAALAEAGRTATLLVDGLDLPTGEGHRADLWAAIGTLTGHADFAHVRVIITARSDDGAAAPPPALRMWRLELRMPSVDDIGRYLLRHARDENGSPWPESRITATLAALDPGVRSGSPWPTRPWEAVGGWLTARLILQVDSRLTDSDITRGLTISALVRHRLGLAQWSLTGERAESLGLLIAVVVAAEPGPVLPIEVVRLALHDLGARTIEETHVRDLAVGLGALIARRGPGSAGEHLGVAHTSLRGPLRAANPRREVSGVRAHRAVLAALARSGTATAAAYREVAAIRHYLGADDPVGALEALSALHAASLPERIELWQAWLPDFVARLGEEHPLTQQVRDTIADWRTQVDQPRRTGRRRRPLAVLGATTVAIVVGLWVSCSGAPPPPTQIATTTGRSEPAIIDTEQVPTDTEGGPTVVERPPTTVPPTKPPSSAVPRIETSEPPTITQKLIESSTVTTTPKKPPCIPYSSHVDFDPTEVGKWTKKYIPFPYMECDNLTVVKLDDGMQGKAFSILDGECPPPQGQTKCYLRVLFHPPDAGSFDGTIEIKQKNGDPRLKITLHGVGT